MERRDFLSNLTVESREDGAKRVVGYGAVFFRAGDPGTEFRLWQDTYERIMPGAFDAAIRDDDPVSLFNHDANFVLGRKSAGTLSVSIDNRGLKYEVTPPDSQTIRDLVLGPINRNEVRGSSIMFVADDVAWLEEKRDGRSVTIREIRSAKLYELGPVVFPAYEGTTTGLRAVGDVESLKDELKRCREGQPRASLDVHFRWLDIQERESAGNV